MDLCYRSSVNSWECDENDHMNVRFYVAKHMETLQSWLLGIGAVQELQPISVSTQHLRFLSESRLSAPLSGFAALTEEGAVVTELRQSVTGEVLSTCLHGLDGEDISATAIATPEHALPRGASSKALHLIEGCSESYLDCGFQLIGQGVVGHREVDSQAALSLENYMGRISDSMPHLWASFGAFGEDDSDGLEGGAVLEYRFHYHTPIRAGERFAVYSGLYQAGAKVQTFAHLVFNQSGGCLATSAMAVGVRMDLTTRRAKAMSDEVLQHLQSLQLTIES